MVISILAFILTAALAIFVALMLVRFGFDWAQVLSPSYRPRGFALVLAEASYSVTDPPIKLVRRVIPPLRIGGAVLDFAWSIILLLCIIGFSLIGSLRALG